MRVANNYQSLEFYSKPLLFYSRSTRYCQLEKLGNLEPFQQPPRGAATVAFVHAEAENFELLDQPAQHAAARIWRLSRAGGTRPFLQQPERACAAGQFLHDGYVFWCKAI